MKKHVLPACCLALALALSGCETDIKVEELEELNAAPTPLQLNNQQIYDTGTSPMDVDGTVKASIFGLRDGIIFEAPVEAGLFSLEIPLLEDTDLMPLADFFGIDEAEIPEQIPDDIKLSSLMFRVYPEGAEPLILGDDQSFFIKNKELETMATFGSIFNVSTGIISEYVYSSHSIRIPEVEVIENPEIGVSGLVLSTIIDLDLNKGWNKIFVEVSERTETSEEDGEIYYCTTRYYKDSEIETAWYPMELF